MNYRRQGLRALGLSLLAALGLMAFTAVGAQASGEWLIEGKTLKELGVAKETIAGNVEDALSGKLLILNLNFTLTCHEGTASGYILPLGHGHVAIDFSVCLLLDKNLKPLLCHLDEPIEADALALVILHNGDPYILFSPLDELTFARITHEDELCPLPEVATVKGNVVAEIKNPDEDTNPLLISTVGLLELFKALEKEELRYGTNPAHLDAIATAGLTGKYVGKPWGAV